MGLYDIVRYEGNQQDWLIYKYKETEFNTKSKLIVSQGQVAILVHNGQIEKILEAGSYKLDTELLPFAKAFVKGLHSGNPYPMEIYFINKRLKLDLLWGTADPIALIDPKYRIQIHLRVRGQIGIRLDNYQYFFQTLVGTLIVDNFISFDVIRNYFRGVINQKIKTTLSKFVIEQQISYFEINTKLDEIQKIFSEELVQEFARFGFDMVNLSIESINAPKDDLDALNDILYKKAEYDQLGDNVYRTARGYDVLEEGAKNNASAGAFMGVGLGVNMAQNASGTSIIPPAGSGRKFCVNCGQEIPEGASFCPGCGTKIETVCPKCGGKVSDGHRFCPTCGEKIR